MTQEAVCITNIELDNLVRFYRKKYPNDSQSNLFTKLANDLGNTLKSPKVWTHNYLLMIYHRKKNPSKNIAIAVNILAAKIVRKKNGVHPVVKTWIPFKGKWEQRKILRALTPNERLIALRQAYKRKTK